MPVIGSPPVPHRSQPTTWPRSRRTTQSARRRIWASSWLTQTTATPVVGHQPARQPFEQEGVVGVEHGRRLVHQQHRRAGGQRPGQAGPLRLAAGEVAGGPLEQRGVEADVAEGGAGGVGGQGRVGDVQVLQHGAVEQRRPLEDHPDLAPQGQRIEVGHVVAAEARPCPTWAAINRLQRRSMVDFPAPDGPASTVIPPSGTVDVDVRASTVDGREADGDVVEPEQARRVAHRHDASEGYGAAMKVALTVNDFLRRAEEVYGDRVGVVDEPEQPAASWGSPHLPRGGPLGPRPRRPASTSSASPRATGWRS